MKQALLLVVFAVMAAGSVFSQDSTSVVSTSTIGSARYEMIQMPGDRSVTFRLDRWAGIVHKLGTCPKDDSIGSAYCWKEMVVVDRPAAAPVEVVRFQIVLNRVLGTTLLLQLDTGRTWQYGVGDPQDRWHPFFECTDKLDRNCLWRPF